MSKLIKNGRIVSDAWKTMTLAEGDTPQSVKLPDHGVDLVDLTPRPLVLGAELGILQPLCQHPFVEADVDSLRHAGNVA